MPSKVQRATDIPTWKDPSNVPPSRPRTPERHRAATVEYDRSFELRGSMDKSGTSVTSTKSMPSRVPRRASDPNIARYLLGAPRTDSRSASPSSLELGEPDPPRKPHRRMANRRKSFSQEEIILEELVEIRRGEQDGDWYVRSRCPAMMLTTSLDLEVI